MYNSDNINLAIKVVLKCDKFNYDVFMEEKKNMEINVITSDIFIPFIYNATTSMQAFGDLKLINHFYLQQPVNFQDLKNYSRYLFCKLFFKRNNLDGDDVLQELPLPYINENLQYALECNNLENEIFNTHLKQKFYL